MSELKSRNVSSGVIALHGGHAGEKAKEAKNMWEYQPANCQTILPGIINFFGCVIKLVNFQYICSSFIVNVYLLIATMGLAGHPSYTYTDKTTRKAPYSANLDCIKDPENSQLLNNFMNALFMIKAKHFTETGRLRHAIETYLASILLNFQYIKNKHGEGHLIVQYIVRTAADLRIPQLLIEAWGNSIRDDLKIHDVQVQGNNVDNILIIDLLTASTVQAKRDNLLLQKALSTQKKDFNEMCSRIEKIEKLLTESHGSASKKRKRQVCYIYIFIYIYR